MYNIKLIYLIILSIPILVQTLFGLTFLSVLLVEFCTKQNTRLQATRFVCCPNREYLEFLVEKHYPLYRNIDFANQMKKDIFNYFK